MDQTVDEKMTPAAVFVRKALRQALWGICYHERCLHEAHQELAKVKAVIERGSYTEFTIAEVQAEVDRSEAERLNEDD